MARRKTVEAQERELLRALRREIYDSQKLFDIGAISRRVYSERVGNVARLVHMLEVKYGLDKEVEDAQREDIKRSEGVA